MEYNITKEQYQSIIATWKAHKEHNATQHILYNLLRSKDLKLGFCERKANIQGNDPWFAFNKAKTEALSILAYKNPWQKYKGDEKWEYMYDRGEADRLKLIEGFKATFGIDIPEGLQELLK
jgi:hypothetical protein